MIVGPAEVMEQLILAALWQDSSLFYSDVQNMIFYFVVEFYHVNLKGAQCHILNIENTFSRTDTAMQTISHMVLLSRLQNKT